MMGVSGCGKSTLGHRIAGVLGVPFVEGDDYHSAQNIQKLSDGIALRDEDREPWLVKIGEAMGQYDACVVACSALKRSYRDMLRELSGRDIIFVFMDIEAGELEQRLAEREGHFMSADLLQSQLDILEAPGDGERYFVWQSHMEVADIVELIRNADFS